jgi:hypothetical protein
MVEAEGDKMLEVQVLVKQEVVLLVQAVLPPDGVKLLMYYLLFIWRGI